MDVLNNDALLKKLNESTITIQTVEIQSTCKVHQVLEKFYLLSFLEVLRIRENSLDLEDITDLLRCLPSLNNLHELDLYRTKFRESTFLAFICCLNHCKDITSLILTDNSLTEQEMNGLITVVKSLKNLKILKLSKCILTETQANAILHTHEQAKNIVTLDLSHNAIQGNEIIVGICQLQSLKELNLSHNSIRFSPLPNFKGKRDSLSTCLKVISLSFNHMKPDDISQFCSLIRSDLLELNLDFNHVGHSIWSLCSLDEKIKHLRVLNLANTNICHDVNGLVSLLSLVKELEDLNLSSNNLLAEDFQQFQTPLSGLSQLKILNLGKNAIGSDGMKALADLFNKFSLLERLDMNSSYIREDEVSVLCKNLVSLKKLKYLNLSENCIDVEVLDDALVLPVTLEELLFSRIIHGEKLFAEMKQLVNLRRLHLNELKLRECDVKALVNMLSCFPKLEELSLANLVAPECETIFAAIKSLRNMKKIDLTGIELSNEQALVDVLSSLTSLEELVLDGMHGIHKNNHKNLFKKTNLSKHLRKLSFDGVKYTNGVKAIYDTLSSLSNLEDVVLPDVSSRSTNCITENVSSLESLRYIRKLDLCGIIFENSTAQALGHVLSSLQLLEQLKLNFEIDSDESLTQLFAAFRRLKYLKELVVHSHLTIGELGLNGLVEVLPLLELLETVTLHFFTTDENNKLLLGALENLRYLKNVSCSLFVTNSDTEAFARALSSLPLLETLHFGTTNFSILECVEQQYAALGKLKYLRKLYLQIIYITKREAEALAKVLPSLELLEELTLRRCRGKKLHSEYEKKVFVAISKLRYLKKIYLDCHRMDYTELEALDKMLPSLPMLKELKLSNICFKDHGQRKGPFIAFGKLKHLTKLCFRWKRITQTNVDALVEGLTSLQMLKKLTLEVNFYCNHDCDDDCDYDCDEECDHNCFVGSCFDTCRHDECVRNMDSVKKKVLDAVKELKYFEEFVLNEDFITYTST